MGIVEQSLSTSGMKDPTLQAVWLFVSENSLD